VSFGSGWMGARRYVNISKPRARSSVGSERLATNQKVGSSSLSGRATFSHTFSFSYKPPFSPRTLPERRCHANVTLRAPGRPCRWLAPCARAPGEPTPTDKRVSSPGYYDAWRAAQLHREQPNSIACRTHGVNYRSGNTKHRPS
jgi:hypothetical protein